MAWIRSNKKGSGGGYDDGNNITYPIINPSSSNKLYCEDDVNNIAVALGQSVKISEMADAISNIGFKTINVDISYIDYTVV